MGTPLNRQDDLLLTKKTFDEIGTIRGTAKRLNIGDATVRSRLNALGCRPKLTGQNRRKPEDKPFEFPELPDEELSVEELFAHKERVFDKMHRAKQARKLIPIKVKIDGPIGIMHFGDPHLDDDGTDIKKLRLCVDLCNRTDGMMAGEAGDITNNWIGRLARLYGQQSTTVSQSWKLAEWFVGGVPWLYLLGGNHDMWSGCGSPINWMKRYPDSSPLMPWSARLKLNFPNGNYATIKARHKYEGHSFWHAIHALVREAKMGIRDNILIGGHKHTSGYAPIDNPEGGIIHCAQVSTFKVYDSYGQDELGHAPSPWLYAPVTIIDPSKPRDHPAFISLHIDPEEGADFLTFLRRKK